MGRTLHPQLERRLVQRVRTCWSQIAGLLGAHPDEVIVADSTSVNFFKLLVAGLRYAEQREAPHPHPD